MASIPASKTELLNVIYILILQDYDNRAGSYLQMIYTLSFKLVKQNLQIMFIKSTYFQKIDMR